MRAKMIVIAKISCYLAQCRYSEIAQRIFKDSNMKYTSFTLDKKTEQFYI